LGSKQRCGAKVKSVPAIVADSAEKQAIEFLGAVEKKAA
jgi:hypothetical protein